MSSICNYEWPDFSGHLETLLADMMSIDKFKDVTLVCGDDTEVLAHKVVLNASSQVFRNIFQNPEYVNPKFQVEENDQAIIYLEGIGKTEMNLLLQFMYLGSLSIESQNVQSFLKAAKDLEIDKLQILETKCADKEYCDKKPNATQLKLKVDLKPTVEPETTENLEGNKNDFNQKSTVSVHLGQSIKVEEDLKVSVPTARNNSVEKIDCYKCDSTFSTRHNFMRHIETVHEKKRKYKCQQCSFDASSKRGIKEHAMRSHKEPIEPIPIFECNQCDKTFLRNNYLQNHIKCVHQGMKSGFQVACPQCGKMLYKRSLQKHIHDIHLEGNYECDKCNKQFTSHNNMKRHIQIEHGGMRFLCDQCDYFTTDKRVVLTHMEKRHGRSVMLADIKHKYYQNIDQSSKQEAAVCVQGKDVALDHISPNHNEEINQSNPHNEKLQKIGSIVIKHKPLTQN